MSTLEENKTIVHRSVEEAPMQMSSKEIINKLFDAYIREDLNDIKDLLADNVKLIVTTFSPKIECEGIEAVLDLVQNTFKKIHLTKIHTNVMMAERDKVMVFLSERGKRIKNESSEEDTIYEGNRLHIYTVKQGKITYAEYYLINDSPVPL